MSGFEIPSPDAFAHQNAQRAGENASKDGHDYIANGGHCDHKQGQPGCFLNDEQRGRLSREFESRVDQAGIRYGFALSELRLEQMMKKDDELSWVVELLIDVATTFIGGAVAGAVTKRAIGAIKDAGLFGEAALAAHNAVAGVATKQLESVAKQAFDPLKKGVKSAAKEKLNEDRVEDQKIETDYISQLQIDSGPAYEEFKFSSLRGADDATLLALYDAMNTHDHSIPKYKAALDDKLKRYKKDVIGKIDPKRDGYDPQSYTGERVVIVVGDRGQRELWYQHAHMQADPDPGSNHEHDCPVPITRFGALSRPVPIEFADVALARSESIWGPAPTIVDPSRIARPPKTAVETAMEAFGHYADPQGAKP